jgi:predicted aspartyl protease
MKRKDDNRGAVYVTVRLSNATDVGMMFRGLLEKGEVRTWEGEALVDTGSTLSLVSPELAEKLGLRIHRQATGVLADGNRVSCGVSMAYFLKSKDAKPPRMPTSWATRS